MRAANTSQKFWAFVVAALLLFASGHQEVDREDVITSGGSSSELKEHAEAMAGIQVLLQEGKDWSACKKLSYTEIKGIMKQQKAKQQAINGLIAAFLTCQDKHCNPSKKVEAPVMALSEGQRPLEQRTLHFHPLFVSLNGCKCTKDEREALAPYQKRESNLKKASSAAKQATRRAEHAPVSVGYTHLSKFTRSCNTFLSNPSYLAAKRKLHAAKKTQLVTSAKYGDAKKATQTAKKAVKKDHDSCMCNLKAAIRKAQQIVKKHNDAARKVWNMAHRQMCIFNNIDAKDCKVPKYPDLMAPRAAKDIKWPSRCSSEEVKISDDEEYDQVEYADTNDAGKVKPVLSLDERMEAFEEEKVDGRMDAFKENTN
jgi:hypothetical protein